MKRITSLTYLHLLQLIKRYLKTKIRFVHLLHQITSKFELTSAAKSRIQWDTFYKKRPSSLSKISTNNHNHNTLITKFNCFIDKLFLQKIILLFKDNEAYVNKSKIFSKCSYCSFLPGCFNSDNNVTT